MHPKDDADQLGGGGMGGHRLTSRTSTITRALHRSVHHVCVCTPACCVYLRFGMRLLCVCCRQERGGRAPLDPGLKQNVLCSLNECVNNFVREENTGGRTIAVY